MEQPYVLGTGRRKNAVARVRIKKGNGLIEINKKSPKEYLCREVLIQIIKQPLEVIDGLSDFDIFINAHGGGLSGQAGAIRMGIARALCEFDAKNRGALKKNGYLRRDPRMVERKKYGQRGARRKFQFSKR